jgi:thiol:disulfide interchange protein DsbD
MPLLRLRRLLRLSVAAPARSPSALVLVVVIAAVVAVAARAGDAPAAATADAPSSTVLVSSASTPPSPSPSASPLSSPPSSSSTVASLTGCQDVPVVAPAAEEDDSIQGRLRAALSAGNLAVAIALVLLGGLLTALSPCVYPLIPITLSILGARQAGSARKGFLLASTYVGGMVVLYTTLGVSFAMAGVLAGSALQSPWVTIGVAAFCVAMAASMFGAFEFVLPASLQTRLSQAGGGGFRGAFVMGLVAGVIAAPCTGPVLSFILTLIARERDVAKGAVLMFFYALGMGLPFLVLGTFSQAIARMPKSGRWMETVKSVFGLLMLGAGLYYLQLGLPAVADLFAPLGGHGLVWGPVLVVVGVAAGALHLSFKGSSLVEKLRKAAGVTTATVGIVAFLAWTNAPAAVAGTVAGAPTLTTTSSPPATAAAVSPTGAAGTGTGAVGTGAVGTGATLAWVHVGAEPDAVARFDAALAAAKKDCRPVMIDFGADWCIACKELDKFVYTDPAVIAEASRFTNIKVDATDDTAGLAALQQRFGVVGLPTVAFIDKSGRYLGDNQEPRHLPITGFLPAAEYLGRMKKVP